MKWSPKNKWSPQSAGRLIQVERKTLLGLEVMPRFFGDATDETKRFLAELNRRIEVAFGHLLNKPVG